MKLFKHINKIHIMDYYAGNKNDTVTILLLD